MKVYISGPISGVGDNNAVAFEQAAKRRRAKGDRVVTPIELDGHLSLPSDRWGDCLGRDLEILRYGKFDAMEMLMDWDLSPGATIEKAYAEFLDLEIFYEVPEPLLDTAESVHADSEPKYSKPLPQVPDPPKESGPHFLCTCRVFEKEGKCQHTGWKLGEFKTVQEQRDAETVMERARPLVEERYKTYGPPEDHFEKVADLWASLFDWEIETSDVPLAMLAFKLARLIESPDHKDTIVDIAGYLDCYERTRNG